VVENSRESADSAEPVPGVTNVRTLSLDRFPIRTRESAVTLSAWRLGVACDEGEGVIVRVDAPAGGRFHRGEGVFLGWSEELLSAAYDAFRPVPEESGFELQQMG
jgi:hypothetical protein